jgi:hypothetical protein
MGPRSRWLIVAVPAAVAALVFAVPGAFSGPAARTGHADGVVRIIQRGLVHDCEYIQVSDSIYEIAGNGVNEPVSLTTAPGNCWNLYNKFSVVFGATVYTGYEYQNGDGHCLWGDGTTIEVGAACKVGHQNEEFFGDFYTEGAGWRVSDVTETPSHYMGAAIFTTTLACGVGSEVVLDPTDVLDCNYWNFPQG